MRELPLQSGVTALAWTTSAERLFAFTFLYLVPFLVFKEQRCISPTPTPSTGSWEAQKRQNSLQLFPAPADACALPSLVADVSLCFGGIFCKNIFFPFCCDSVL